MQKHIDAGAEYSILSAPAQGDEVPTVVYGVNQPQGEPKRILSCASCTANCITPVVEIMGRRIRRGRAGAANLVPTSTGAATATAKALPEFEGRFNGVAVRASIVDLGMTLVVDGDLVKVMSWYDNEWDYTAQMIREGVRIAEQLPKL